MKPHKWAKEIKAWADGAEIETRYVSNDGWTNWDETIEPKWYIEDDIEYRIKPQPKEPQYLSVWKPYDPAEDLIISDVKANGIFDDGIYKLIGKIKLETEND
jgi:hypothetical protein